MALVTVAQERPGMVLSSAVKDQRGGRPREYRVPATLGCAVATASNGREAVSAATTSKFDLLLMDCQTPEMDGHVTEPMNLGTLRGALARWLPLERGPEAEEIPAGTPVGASRTGDDSLPIFDEQWPVLEDRLDVGLATGDAEELRATAPLIRGAAANLSAKRIAWYAREAEQVWGTGALEGAEERIRTIRQGVEFLIEVERAREGAIIA